MALDLQINQADLSNHGASLDAISVGGEALFRHDIGPLLPGTEHVLPPDEYRCLWECGERGGCDENHNLAAHARELGRYALARMIEMMERHPLFGDVRGLGLLLGIELVKDRATSGMKDSFFGDLHGQGRDAIQFFTERKVVISRWF